MTPRVAIPSKGRLRDSVLELLDHAGYRTGGFRGSGARATIDGIEFIEMRPRDAGAWLAAGRLDGAIVSTDIVLEEQIESSHRTPLGFSKSDLVVASREDDGRAEPADLAGATIATHLPRATNTWFQRLGIEVNVVTMGGALEGVCAAGLADAVVDLRETGSSLAQNRLRVLAELAACEAEFVVASDALTDLSVRLDAAIRAKRHRYLMLHLPPGRIDGLSHIFPGLAAPTVLPLAGRDDIVAVHLVVEQRSLFQRLGELQQLGATGIVALPPDALLP
ncbi:MAG TPA: ATP phosphoribosyltransferase [Acidimicrobiales bacterium]|nr:ATP phosphoribosyltransferase [Acidimicrobiales bacterium]